jgi:uncharacterized membrane protein required for colicin V production
MGLDIALGAIVLVAGIRGWLKGFLLQAIQLGALVGCVYLAAPLRDLARPYALDYFPGIQPEILDKLLWWVGAVLAYLVTAGIAISTVRLYRRRHYLEGMEPNRGDQGAGFLLGAAKGALIAVFLAAGISRYVPAYVKSSGWLPEQIASSRALQLSERYHPADQLWRSAPVQEFVSRIRAGGLGEKPSSRDTARLDEPSHVQAPPPAKDPLPSEIHPPALSIPGRSIDPHSPDFLNELDRELARELGQGKVRSKSR